ncbi:MAG TPA: response regulator transcription factor [Verrucomicrobiae bacterium]|nr:response regulator transcription factor [Verrucomicrobiae bacterium]
MSKPVPIRVLIVEDDDRIRNSLLALIDGSDGFRCAGAFSNAEETMKEISNARPDVVLLDINLPKISGIECIQEIKSRLPAVKILMHTVYEDEEQLFKSLRAGANGYLLKRTPPARLLEAITDVHGGDSVMSSQIARLVVKYFHQLGPDNATGKLTHREVEILQHLARGYQNKEIADLLSIGFDTVRTHLRNIYEKLHVNSRTEAVMKFLGR